jgi:hypothetical protein
VLSRDSLLVEGVEAVDFVFFFADFEDGAAVETVRRHEWAFLNKWMLRVVLETRGILKVIV